MAPFCLVGKLSTKSDLKDAYGYPVRLFCVGFLNEHKTAVFSSVYQFFCKIKNGTSRVFKTVLVFEIHRVKMKSITFEVFQLSFN